MVHGRIDHNEAVTVTVIAGRIDTPVVPRDCAWAQGGGRLPGQMGKYIGMWCERALACHVTAGWYRMSFSIHRILCYQVVSDQVSPSRQHHDLRGRGERQVSARDLARWFY